MLKVTKWLTLVKIVLLLTFLHNEVPVNYDTVIYKIARNTQGERQSLSDLKWCSKVADNYNLDVTCCFAVYVALFC